jgi:hypothetical protein
MLLSILKMKKRFTRTISEKNKLMSKRVFFVLIVIIALSTSCRKPYYCVCTIYQPNVNPVITTVIIDNTRPKASITCNAIQLVVVGTATTNCYISN